MCVRFGYPKRNQRAPSEYRVWRQMQEEEKGITIPIKNFVLFLSNHLIRNVINYVAMKRQKKIIENKWELR